MSKTGEIPYTWKQIEDQLREAILCQASILASFGPRHDQNLVADYLCIDRDAYLGRSVEDVRADEIDIAGHQLVRIVRAAYDYAYQLDGAPADMASEWHDVGGLLEGFPQTDAMGEPSPFCTLNDFPLRRMLETFYARYGLFASDSPDLIDYRPTIRELALLANMTVPAVRTSLSKEGFRLEKVQSASRANQEESSFRLNTEDARIWLSRRRGFIPQRDASDPERIEAAIAETLADRTLPFPEAVRRIMTYRMLDFTTLCQRAELPPGSVSDLLEGKGIAADVTMLKALATALQVAPIELVPAGIRHALLTEAKA